MTDEIKEKVKPINRIDLGPASGDEVVGELNLKDSLKYKEMVSQSLERYGDKKEAPTGLKKIEEVVPWSIHTCKIFGTTWFNVIVYVVVANILVSAYFSITSLDSITGVEAEKQRNEMFVGVEEDLAPFKQFIGLSPAVADEEYSSFIRALAALNTYFPTQLFEKTDYFVEDGFTFHPGGLSYSDPQ